MSDMTLITDMALPDEVVEAAAEAIEFEFMNGAFVEDVSVDFKFPARLAIRAALQAMCDCGMAKVESRPLMCGCEGPPSAYTYQMLSIRLDKQEPAKNWAHYEGREEDEQYEL